MIQEYAGFGLSTKGTFHELPLTVAAWAVDHLGDNSDRVSRPAYDSLLKVILQVREYAYNP